MLVGLPASGKSTLAKKLLKQYNAILISSDEIREEMYGDVNNQDNNHDVFEVMNNRAKQTLSDGINIIYDATNINRKRRIHLINQVLRADEKIVYYMNGTIKTIKYRNEYRSRIVPEDVIDKMYKTLHIPVKNEGWDQVIFTQHPNNYLTRYREHCEDFIQSNPGHDKLFDELSVFIPEFSNIFNLPQDSSFHSFSVSRHTYHVYEKILNDYKKEDKLVLLWSALFHDIGKAFCKSFINYKGEETKYASFIGHEYVSSQVAASYLDLLSYDQKFIESVSTLIQFHMMPMKASEKKMRQVESLLGDDLFQKLMILNNADKNAK